MNFVFRAYPSHPWLNDWSLEPRGCSTAFRERNAEQFFKSLSAVGRIAPRLDNALWSLQIPVPQNSRTTILFNGFCAYFESRKKKCAAEVFTPEPGVLWGRVDNTPRPVLLTEHPLEEDDNHQWLGNDDCPALLMVRGNTFCLISKTRIQREAMRLAQTYLDRDLEAYLNEELAHRKGASAFFEQMAHHDSLAAISTESLMRSIRPAEGHIPLTWSECPDAQKPTFNTNEILPLAMAWRIIDISIAEELILCVLRLQVSSGAIPASHSPHGTYSVLEAPKPVLTKAAELVWNESRNMAFLEAVIPHLRRHLQWLLHHFDPKKRGLHCWQNSSETLVPHLFKTDLSTVDLTALLLTEIDALNTMRIQSATLSETPPYFQEERTILHDNLLNHFWNAEKGGFVNAYVRDKITEIPGFPAYTPLLLKELPQTYRENTLDSIKNSEYLPGGLNILSWRKTAVDEDSTALIRQTIILLALLATEPRGTLMSDFSRITLQEFVEWHTLSLEEHKTLNIHPAMAAYILNIQNTHQYRYHAKSPVVGKQINALRKMRLDRFDAAVVAVTLFAVISVHSIYRVMHSAPPLAIIEARMNSEYTSRDLPQCLQSCRTIIKHYPEQDATAQLLAGNIFIYFGNYDEAIPYFEAVRKKSPDSPSAMIALGLAHQLQGNFSEAEKNYAEFCFLFDQIFPDLVAEINQFRILMQEGFRSPPKWIEIYRYKIMHEL